MKESKIERISFYCKPYAGTLRGGAKNFLRHIDTTDVTQFLLSNDDVTKLQTIFSKHRRVKIGIGKLPYREYYLGIYNFCGEIFHIVICSDSILFIEKNYLFKIEDKTDIELVKLIIDSIKAAK